MAVPVQVNIESAAASADNLLLGRVDEALEFAPGLLSQRVSCCGLDYFAVAVEFAAVQPADEDVRPVARSRMQFLRHRPGQFLCVGIESKSPFCPVRNLLR